MKYLLALSCVVLVFTSSAPAWWDTQVRAQTPEPLVRAFTAAECGAKGLLPDAQADGGRGGKVALVAPGEALRLGLDLKPSVYCVWIIARARAEDAKPPEQRDQEVELPGGKVTIRCPRPLVYATLAVSYPGGGRRSWYVPIAYRTDYAVASKLYFPVHAAGRCELAVGLDARSRIGLLVNRVEVRDVLGHCPRLAAKDRRMLTSDADLAALRASRPEPVKAPRPRWWRLDDWRWQWTPGAPPPPPAAERRQEAEKLWALVPDWNVLTADPTHARWGRLMARGRAGIVGELADAYERTGDPNVGWMGAVLLCALAEKYPGLDHAYQEAGPYSWLGSTQPLRWGTRLGKHVYSGWAGPDLMAFAEAYDRLFDFLAGNRELAEYLHGKIAWVRTPDDVRKLLDTHILQHGWDCVHRRIIRSDEAYAFLPLVQGVNGVSRDMLARGLFAKVHTNMTDAGGIDDQAFTSYNRGGVHYIGSTLYVGPKLTEIAETLSRYVAAGGEKRFDLSDRRRYPHLPEAACTKNALHAAGGFPIVVGDAMDLRRGRVADMPEYPSRVLEGFGQVVLEAGQGQGNPLLKRAVAIHTGLGRGHAHQDCLNLEMFAHGCRLAPDLGGRHEGRNRSSPNMRINRMHNLVWVDDREFCNPYPGSTVGATGWTTSFSPQPGCRYTANAARATSHPQVSLYHRSTAMIDGAVSEDRADVYVFDVFRVAGGKVHTYCFHGAAADAVEANVKLSPAASPEAKAVLAGRPEGSKLEGKAGDPLVATWPLRAKLQESYQGGDHYRAGEAVGLTMHLFGCAGDGVYVGSAGSEAYPVDLPYLHVRRRAAAGELASVYPAIYEAHAGGRFVRSARRLKVAPQADPARGAVALEVRIEGRTDVLFSSLQPGTAHKLEGGLEVAGEFALLSRDADGPRMLHLVGGTKLRAGDVAVECDRAAWEARIERVEYPNQAMTLSDDFPAKLLDGAVALIGNERHREAFQLATAAGREASVVRTPRYYQSEITAIDAAQRRVSTELEPQVYGCDTHFADGTTVTDEAGRRCWRAALEPAERWMYLGWPGTDLSHPREIRGEDLPDTNGDGRRTLKLLGRGDDGEEAGKVLLELEVTRFVPVDHVFYFRMPDDPNYQIGGWQYAHRELVNEDGSKRWWATYPGTSYSWRLAGEGPLPADAFGDADGDGKRKLLAWQFGPGDTVQVKAFVHVRRAGRGRYEVRANVPCTVRLPGLPAASLTADRLAAGPVILEKPGN